MGRPPKRKATETASPTLPAGKKKQKTEPTASSTRPSRTSLNAVNAPRLTRSASNGTTPNNADDKNSPNHKKTVGPPRERKADRGLKKASPRASKAPAAEEADEPAHGDNEATQTNISVAVPSKGKKAKAKAKKQEAVGESEDEAGSDGRQYWLMKAEPESRIEKGKDVKFSIDDLEAATSPEPWDGVRNLEARNHMRAMTKGDMAFFYHSNCKVPGIVGIMEIVQEHSVDESAFDPEHPYYDEKSSRENPKWHLVHVAFRQKFPEIINLKELQKFSKEGGILKNMQTLKRTRLSVSKVSKKEWDFIMSLVDIEDGAAASSQHQPQLIPNGSGVTITTDTEADREAPVPAKKAQASGPRRPKRTKNPDYRIIPESPFPPKNHDQAAVQDESIGDQSGVVNGGTVEEMGFDLAVAAEGPASDNGA